MSAFVSSSPVAGVNSVRGLLRVLAMDARGRTAAMAAIPSGARAKEKVGEKPQPVSIFAAVDEALLGEGEPAGVVLKVKVDEGYHVNAADPGLAGLMGLRVKIINGSGVAAFADYPAGEEYRPAWAVGDEKADRPVIRVYKGEFTVPVILERSGEWKGKPLLAVTYQACTDEACLAPVTVELDVMIGRQ